MIERDLMTDIQSFSPDSTNWLTNPIDFALEFIYQENRYNLGITKSLLLSRKMQYFFQKFEEELLKSRNVRFRVTIGHLFGEQKNVEEIIQIFGDSQFGYFNRHQFISTWGAFLTAIEDLCAVMFVNRSELAKSSLDEHGIVLGSLESLSEDEARRKFRKLAGKRGEKASAFRRHLFCLESLNLNLYLPPDNIEKLSQFGVMRNCLVHRGGVIDKKAIEEASELTKYADDRIYIDANILSDQTKAITDFLLELRSQALTSQYY